MRRIVGGWGQGGEGPTLALLCRNLGVGPTLLRRASGSFSIPTRQQYEGV
jgi:hypothetical protein